MCMYVLWSAVVQEKSLRSSGRLQTQVQLQIQVFIDILVA